MADKSAIPKCRNCGKPLRELASNSSLCQDCLFHKYEISESLDTNDPELMRWLWDKYPGPGDLDAGSWLEYGKLSPGMILHNCDMWEEEFCMRCSETPSMSDDDWQDLSEMIEVIAKTKGIDILPFINCWTLCPTSGFPFNEEVFQRARGASNVIRELTSTIKAEILEKSCSSRLVELDQSRPVTPPLNSDSTVSKSEKKGPGRPGPSKESLQEQDELFEDWKQAKGSGISMTEFAQDRNIPFPDMKRMLGTIGRRKNRFRQKQ